jgi:GNAT superfamily N-acetyltransferase
LEDLFVRPEFRGRGVGKSLLAYLAKLALARGCGRFEWAVLDWNRRAQEFYESLGAQARTDWIGYRITGDALRRLSEAGT